jgi:hypothetical protein
MLFRQRFDHESPTYTYLTANRTGGKALVVDPVLERTDRHTQFLQATDLRQPY